MDFITFAFYDDAECGYEIKELFEFLLFWILMDTVEERYIHPVEVFGHRFVGEQHEFLDQLLARAAFADHDVFRDAVRTDEDLGFFEVEVDCTAAVPLLPEDRCKVA